jgi:hypothetical protein
MPCGELKKILAFFNAADSSKIGETTYLHASLKSGGNWIMVAGRRIFN